LKEITMEARMTNPAVVVPGAMDALQALGKVVHGGAVPQETLDLVYLRASQINGCSVCVDLHARSARKAGETDDRLFAVAAWREAPYFTGAERAAFALAECLCRMNDRAEAVPDDVWDEAADHYDEQALATLVLAIASVNVWNRLNAATRQIAGAWTP
jgi:AhpD family alkylhydroperoxidase